VVEGNTSISCGFEAIAIYAQSTQGSVKGCVVQGNSIKSAGFQGIGVSVNSTDNIIANNYIEAAAQYGIQLEGSTAANTYPLRNVVCDNNVVDCGTQQIRVINASNNIFVGNTTSAVSVTPVSNRGINIDSAGTPSSYPSGNFVGNNTYNNLAGGVYIGSNAGVYFGIAERQEQEEWLTAADGDTTPSVLNTKHLVLSNTGATTVTNFDVYSLGVKYTKTAEIKQILAAAGLYYIYFDTAGVIQSSTDAWDIGTGAIPIAQAREPREGCGGVWGR
jgi:hypothetical protein